MKRTIGAIYAYAVCFVVLICFAITLGIAMYDVIGIFNPKFTMNSWDLPRLLSNEKYCSSIPATSAPEVCKSNNQAEITKARLEAYQHELDNEVFSDKQSLVRCLIVLLIDLMLFIPHWRMARRID